MNIGRNEPCPCGSGRKYKKCCLPKNEKEKATPGGTAAPSDPSDTASKRGKESDPKVEAANRLWEAFEASDYEGRIDLFCRTLDEPDLMDGEMAFGMLGALFNETIEYGERDRFDALVASLRQRRPEAFAAEAPILLAWGIANALAAGRSKDVSTLARELAPHAGKHIDTFNRVESQLAYHGCLSTLVEAMRLAWPQVEASDQIMPWGIDEFRSRAINYELFECVERNPASDAADNGLLERLKFFDGADLEDLSEYLSHLAGREGRRWILTDFQLPPPRRRPSRNWDDDADDAGAEDSVIPPLSAEKDLYYLTIDFLGYLRRSEDVPYTRAELGRRELHQFILQRHAGELEYRESMLQSMQRDQKGRGKRKAPPVRRFKPDSHELVPDPERLDRFLSGLLGMVNQLYHRAAAVFEIIPPWLRFLESRGLIDTETRTRSQDDLAKLAGYLKKIFASFKEDATPGRRVQQWGK